MPALIAGMHGEDGVGQGAWRIPYLRMSLEAASEN
jgi:hypothetical protein